MIEKYIIGIFINNKKHKFKYKRTTDLYTKLKEYYYFNFNGGKNYSFNTFDNNIIIDNLIKSLKMYYDILNWCNYDNFFISDKFRSVIESRLYGLTINAGDTVYLKIKDSLFNKEKLKLKLKNDIEKLINDDILRNIEREMNFKSLLSNINEIKKQNLRYIFGELDKITLNKYNYSKII